MSQEFELEPTSLKLADHHPRSSASVVVTHDLTWSVRLYGQIDPIQVIRQRDGSYVIHDGARRTIACAELGQPVRAVEIPDGKRNDMFLLYCQTHRLRQPSQPGAVLMAFIYEQISQRTVSKRCIVGRLARSLAIRRGRVLYLYNQWLLIRKRGWSERAIAERWSSQNVLRALGGESQRERKGLLKRPVWSAVRPESVLMTRNADGTTVMTCTMPADASPDELAAYYKSKRWPDPEYVA